MAGALKKTQVVEVEWRTLNFLSAPYQHEDVESPQFNVLGVDWSLAIRRQYGEKDRHLGYVGVFLNKHGSPHISPWVECTVSIKSANGKKYYETLTCDAQKFLDQRFYDLLPTSTLISKKKLLLPGDVLTIVCSFIVPEEQTISSSSVHEVIEREDKIEKEDLGIINEVENGTLTSKGLDRLSEDLKNMLFIAQNTDTVLKADQREFHVHKAILAARSPVFASMFLHEMSEKTSGIVNVPDCTAESFDAFLQYLYSGRADDISSSNVFNLHYAADKYQVNDLKEECVEFMKNNLKVKTVCDVIALSSRHCETELQETATQFFCENVKAIIKTVEWQEYLKENLIQGNELIIKAFNA